VISLTYCATTNEVRYGVKGWSISQAKSADTAGGHWKEGDILFDVRFERKDHVPLQEILERPTATEVDDYAEYKRLRKLHREGKRKLPGLTIDLSEIGVQLPSKTAPPIASPAVSIGETPKILHTEYPLETQKTLLRHPHFDLPEESPSDQEDSASPTNTRDTDYFVLPPRRGSTLVVPKHTSRRPQNADDSSPQGTPSDRSRGTNSKTSSLHTGASTQSRIREVAPWIDFDADLTQPHVPESGSALVLHKASVSQPLLVPSPKKSDAAHHTHRHGPIHRHKFRLPQDSPPSALRRERRKSGDFKGLPAMLSPGSHKHKDGRKSTFARSLNPIAKLLDGADSEDYVGNPRLRRRATSSDGAGRVYSPVPLRPFSPLGVYGAEDDKCVVSPLDDPFVEVLSPRFIVSLAKVGAQPKVATTVGCGVFEAGAAWEESEGVEERLRKTMDGAEGKVVFKNPWSGSPAARRKRGRKGGGGGK
jgi:hypothetical protein